MQLFEFLLVLAALRCGLVAGFLLAFAIVAMPGLGTLGDREFLSGFRAMDRIIQNRQPIFMVIWVGSVATLISTVIIGWSQVGGISRSLLVSGGLVYLLGVQAPTARINIPLNNGDRRSIQTRCPRSNWPTCAGHSSRAGIVGMPYAPSWR